MRAWYADLDRILRGEATRLAALRRGTIEVSVGRLVVVLATLAMVYGACMGCHALGAVIFTSVNGPTDTIVRATIENFSGNLGLLVDGQMYLRTYICLICKIACYLNNLAISEDVLCRYSRLAACCWLGLTRCSISLIMRSAASKFGAAQA